jgi:23S rRNA (uracil1939-C5)-methyltransferase
MSHKTCSVYTICGGCAYQDLTLHDYQNHKNTHFKTAFKLLHLSDEVYQTPIFIPDETRRRTTISFYHDGKNFVWGYKQEKSHKIINSDDCIVVTPNILKAMQTLPDFIKSYIKPEIQIKVHITEATNGLDISIKGIKAPKAKEATEFNDNFFKQIPNAIRLTIDTHIIGQLETPYITIQDFKVLLPLDVFLQPSQQGQETLITEVIHRLGKITKKTKIVDLFCGLGTFTLPLAKLSFVTAYDNAGEALRALIETKDIYGLGNRINAKPRDLFRDPLSFLELNTYDIAVIDPPRAGAEAQTQQLAKSNLKKIIYVFCDTHTASRDLLILQTAGYQITSIRAIDQFIYSHHIEGVAVLEKK